MTRSLRNAFPVPAPIRVFSGISGPGTRSFCILEGTGARVALYGCTSNAPTSHLDSAPAGRGSLRWSSVSNSRSASTWPSSGIRSVCYRRFAAKRLRGRLSGAQKLRVLAIETHSESNTNDLARRLRSRSFDAPPKDGEHALGGFVHSGCSSAACVQRW
jgi:hypothetical protein